MNTADDLWEVRTPPQVVALELRGGDKPTLVLLAVAFGVDLLRELHLTSGYPIIGQLITGLIVGRGSNYLHDLVDRWLGPLPRVTGVPWG